MTDENQAVKVKERMVLKKFLGDGPEDRTDDPVEIIVVENGQIVEHKKLNAQGEYENVPTH